MCAAPVELLLCHCAKSIVFHRFKVRAISPTLPSTGPQQSTRHTMHWHQIKLTASIIVSGHVYDLHHLQDSNFNFNIPATTRHPEINAGMLIQYSSHCVTTGPPRGERHDFSELEHDRLVIDEKGNERCFSIDRYRWSANLPGIIRSLPSGRRCFFTGHGNWLSIQILDSPSRNQVDEVYFNVSRQSRNFLRLYVESAYVRTEGNEIHRPSDFKREHKIGGELLLAKKLRGEPIIRPQQR